MNKDNLWLKSFLLLTAISILFSLKNLFISAKSHTTSTANNLMGDKALLIKVDGAIHSGPSTYQSTGAETILALLKKASDRSDIKGVLLEINSPGGTVGASQEVYTEIMKLRKKKKVVVAMKDLAASGGYYIAAAADYIFTQPGTITGSIGVIMTSPNIKGLLDKYSVGMRVYKAGKYKDILSMYRNVTPQESLFLKELLDDTYQQFLKDVAAGRKLPIEKVNGFAEGRIFSGTRAVQNKMVDAIGGRREALRKLSDLCETKETLQLLQDEATPFDKFLKLMEMKLDTLAVGGLKIPQNSAPIMAILPASLPLGLGL
ncbi:MAG: signal peptide peptidase SppA [Spirochaetota bacterium]